MSNRGCSDSSCPFRSHGGMRTNGGCRCFGKGATMTPDERSQLRAWVHEMRVERDAAVAKLGRVIATLRDAPNALRMTQELLTDISSILRDKT